MARSEKISKREDNSQSRAREVAEEQEAFLQRFSECGSILQASEETGVVRRQHYVWMANDPDYKARFQAARIQAVDALEARVFQRANVESDRLAEFLLKGLRPDVYGDRMKAELTGANGADLFARLQRGKARAED